jgi:hypothetical protein
MIRTYRRRRCTSYIRKTECNYRRYGALDSAWQHLTALHSGHSYIWFS